MAWHVILLLSPVALVSNTITRCTGVSPRKPVVAGMDVMNRSRRSGSTDEAACAKFFTLVSRRNSF